MLFGQIDLKNLLMGELLIGNKNLTFPSKIIRCKLSNFLNSCHSNLNKIGTGRNNAYNFRST